MENPIIERVKYIIEQEGTNARNFAYDIKFNYSTLNNYLIGRRSTIDCELIKKIILAYDNISAEWLLLGKGEMLISDRIKKIKEDLLNQHQMSLSNHKTDDIKTGDMQSVYETVVKDKDEQIEKMKAEINQLIGENSIMREQLGIASRKISNKSA